MNRLLTIISILLLLVMAVSVQAQDIGGMYYQSGQTSLVVVAAGDGTPVITSGNVYFDIAPSTYVRYWASIKTKINATTDASSTTNLTIDIDDNQTNGAPPLINGYLPTTSDYVICGGKSGNSFQQLDAVGTAVGISTNAFGTVKCKATLVVGTAITTVGARDPIYFVDSTDIVSQTLSSEVVNAQDHGIGYRNMPFVVGQTMTGGVAEVSGTYEYWKSGRR